MAASTLEIVVGRCDLPPTIGRKQANHVKYCAVHTYRVNIECDIGTDINNTIHA